MPARPRLYFQRLLKVDNAPDRVSSESPRTTLVPGATKLPLIINVAATGLGPNQEWRWFEKHFPDRLRWEFWGNSPKNWLERQIKHPNLALTRASWQAAKLACREHASLFVSHDPRATLRCSVALELLRCKIPHFCWTLNFARLPSKLTRPLWSHAFASVDRFLTYSSMERPLYAEYFGIPIEKIDMIHWGQNVPIVGQPERAIEAGEYICALGENMRDYPTLMAAMTLLPHIRLVAVVRPYNLKGLKVPPNVTIRTDIDRGSANNILANSRLMVLPLVGLEIPCGHTTLVSAMQLGVPSIVTRSKGLHDYVHEGHNTVVCDPFSPQDLAKAISRLWEDRALRDTLVANSRKFVDECCTERSHLQYFTAMVKSFGLLEDRD